MGYLKAEILLICKCFIVIVRIFLVYHSNHFSNGTFLFNFSIIIIFAYIYMVPNIAHHHHHHLKLMVRISLTLFSIHPNHSLFPAILSNYIMCTLRCDVNKFLAGWPTLAHTCVGVHKRRSFMNLFLLSPANLRMSSSSFLDSY